ncbi:MAG: hypothetical protein WBG32_19375 [Nodosilinea sp.]
MQLGLGEAAIATSPNAFYLAQTLLDMLHNLHLAGVIALDWDDVVEFDFGG